MGGRSGLWRREAACPRQSTSVSRIREQKVKTTAQDVARDGNWGF
jgi:hypothetical protein